MLKILTHTATGRCYWIGLILLGLSLLVVALFYQYALDQLPCVLCVHVRLLITGVVLLAVLALTLLRWRWLVTAAHTINTVLMVILFDRAWVLLGTERGTLIAACDFELGFPPWFAFDKWWPALYQVQTSCGYTPKLLFGVTMAEALTVMSGVLVIVSLVLTLVSLRRA